jgi:hypothetical protein
MRDQRQADDCCVGVTVHRGRTDHRPQPLRSRLSISSIRFDTFGSACACEGGV